MNIEVDHERQVIRLVAAGTVSLADLAEAAPFAFEITPPQLLPERTWLRRLFAKLTGRQKYTGAVYNMGCWQIEIAVPDVTISGGTLTITGGAGGAGE